MENFNVRCVILGGGVAGLAIARRLVETSEDIYLLEINNLLGQETSSRNSEVIHAGIYYDKNSLKSKLCLRGKELLYEYLASRDINYQKCGKFIVSSDEEEMEELDNIKKNAFDCGMEDLYFDNSVNSKYSFLNSKLALFSPSTGIFDSSSYIHSLHQEFEAQGGKVLFGNECLRIEKSNSAWELEVKDINNNESFIIHTELLINAAGLNACKFANQINQNNKYDIELIKGEYYSYSGKEKLEHLIYPLPNKLSLGIHATIDLGNGIRFGPSAYKVDEIEYRIDSSQKETFQNSISKYWPKIEASKLVPDYSGIRAKVRNYDDFIVEVVESNNEVAINILNYISPGLTSSLALAEYVETSLIDLQHFSL